MNTPTRKVAINSIILSVFLLFALVPWLGFINLGVVKITLMPLVYLICFYSLSITTKLNLIWSSLIYGFLFGFASWLQAIMYPDLSAVIFLNPLFSILPRVLMSLVVGLIAYYANKFYFLDHQQHKKYMFIIMGFLAPTFNTIFTLGFILMFGRLIYHDENAIKIFNAISWFILLTNYLPEMLISLLVFPPVGYALDKLYG